MYRKITSRYSGKCAKCGNAIYPGDLIYWQKGSRSIFHSACYGTESEPARIEVEPSLPASDTVFSIDVSELKKRMVQALKGDYTFLKRAKNRSILQSEVCRNSSDWRGFTNSELTSWIASGYKSDVFSDIHEVSPPLRKKRKIVYGDEGELQLDLAYSGFDYPFIQWTKRESVPGLSVDIRLAFSGSTNGPTVVEYEKWVARMLYTLESEGIDLDVNVILDTAGSFSGSDKSMAVRVNVKREQEASDFARWSVMVSPAGLRGMLFLAVIMGCDAAGQDCVSSLGRPTQPNRWDLSFEPQSRKLTIEHPKSASSFPAEEMTEKLRTVIKEFH